MGRGKSGTLACNTLGLKSESMQWVIVVEQDMPYIASGENVPLKIYLLVSINEGKSNGYKFVQMEEMK